MPTLLENFPEEDRGDEKIIDYLGKHEKFHELIKEKVSQSAKERETLSTLEADLKKQKELVNKSVVLPTEQDIADKSETFRGYLKKTGVPESEEGYASEKLDAIKEIADSEKADVRKRALEMGLTKKQFENYVDAIEQSAGKAVSDANEYIVDQKKIIADEWKENYETNYKKVFEFLEKAEGFIRQGETKEQSTNRILAQPDAMRFALYLANSNTNPTLVNLIGINKKSAERMGAMEQLRQRQSK